MQENDLIFWKCGWFHFVDVSTNLMNLGLWKNRLLYATIICR